MSLMRYLILPLYLLRLILAAVPSLFLLLLAKLKPFKTLVVAMLVLGIILLSIVSYLSPINSAAQTTPPTPDLTSLQKQELVLQTWLQKQPAHRDLLLNLALVYEAMGNKAQAEELLNQAKILDPNHEFFRQAEEI